MKLSEKNNKNNSLPQHIGILIDGNRRWAKHKGLAPIEGHRQGAKNVVKIINYALKKGIKVLTLYGFSTENWKRSKEEVDYLMDLFIQFASKYLPRAAKSGIRFNHIGKKDRLSFSLRKKIKFAERLTKNNTKMVLNIALDYGGRDEVARAVRKVIKDKIPSEKITEDVFMRYLDTADLPDIDFVIRTSGEMRLSNFFPLQAAYAELYFPKIFWPDFDEHQFNLALKEFQRRQRRLGK